MESLVKGETGASHVLAFDHNLRRTAATREKPDGVQGPVLAAHNDYTDSSGPQRVRDLLSADEAETRLKSRFAVINVWRPIRGPVRSMPLAVCWSPVARRARLSGWFIPHRLPPSGGGNPSQPLLPLGVS